jgi:hypothetical protein
MCATKKMGESECVTIHTEWRYLYRTKKKEEKKTLEKTYGHTIPLNSSDRSTVEQNRPPSIFYFYFF